ncbi:MAG: hypothetical protein NVS3B21_17740 [Acidimicrobiales bacterium]
MAPTGKGLSFRSPSFRNLFPIVSSGYLTLITQHQFRKETVSFRKDFRKCCGKPSGSSWRLRRSSGTVTLMARTADTYTAAQAAQLLGVSERRVRQLVNEGKLVGERGDDGAVRVPQQSVNEERKRRRAKPTAAAPVREGRVRRGAVAAEVDMEQFADRVANAVGQRLQGQLEITRQAESLVRDELDAERARRTEAELRLQKAETDLGAANLRIAELEATQRDAATRKGLFRRR